MGEGYLCVNVIIFMVLPVSLHTSGILVVVVKWSTMASFDLTCVGCLVLVMNKNRNHWSCFHILLEVGSESIINVKLVRLDVTAQGFLLELKYNRILVYLHLLLNHLPFKGYIYA